MVKIRLMRIGAKKRPFYRVVAVDERSKRTGGYIELLGTYNPLTTPKEIKLNQERIDVWIKNGAVMSDGFLRIIGKAPQKPARKPKKAPKEVAAPQTEAVAPTETPEASEPVSDEVTETAVTNEEPVTAEAKTEAVPEATDSVTEPESSEVIEAPASDDQETTN